MRRTITSTLFAVAVAGAALTLTTPAAFAATWNVTGNTNSDGSVALASAGASGLRIHTPDGDVTVACASSVGTGNVPNVSGSDGAPIGGILSLSFASCTVGGIFSVAWANNGLPWELDVNSQSGTVVGGAIPTGIDIELTSPFCNIAVSGPNDNLDGSVPFTYDNSDGALDVEGGGNLVVEDFLGCGSLIDAGDSVELFTDYDDSPVVQINQSS